MIVPPSGGPKLTDEQARPLAVGGASVALSSGAGCGKTTVLTARFLRDLEGPERRPLGAIVALDVHREGGARAQEADPQDLPRQARRGRRPGALAVHPARAGGGAHRHLPRVLLARPPPLRPRSGDRSRLHGPRRAARPLGPLRGPGEGAARMALRRRSRPDRAGHRIRPRIGPTVPPGSDRPSGGRRAGRVARPVRPGTGRHLGGRLGEKGPRRPAARGGQGVACLPLPALGARVLARGDAHAPRLPPGRAPEPGTRGGDRGMARRDPRVRQGPGRRDEEALGLARDS